MQRSLLRPNKVHHCCRACPASAGRPGQCPTPAEALVAAGLVLPLLGGLPDALIVGVSAFASSREAAQEEVAVGIGALAGLVCCRLLNNAQHSAGVLCLPVSVSLACRLDALTESSRQTPAASFSKNTVSAPSCALLACCSGMLACQDSICQTSSAWHAHSHAPCTAGSNVLLLSLGWGGSILLGRCDFDDQGRARNKTLTRRGDWFSTGVTLEDGTSQGALLMALTALFYGFVQVCSSL